MAMTMWSDWSDFNDMQRDLQQLMQPSFGSRALSQRFQFVPKIDVKESDKALTIHAELPGMSKKDVQLNFRNNAIELSGEKQETKRDESERYQRVERSYGRFFRRIPIPEGTDQSQIKAKFNNGVLEVSVPKSEKKGAETVMIE